jgi:hypothetical protein
MEVEASRIAGTPAEAAAGGAPGFAAGLGERSRNFAPHAEHSPAAPGFFGRVRGFEQRGQAIGMTRLRPVVNGGILRENSKTG